MKTIFQQILESLKICLGLVPGLEDVDISIESPVPALVECDVGINILKIRADKNEIPVGSPYDIWDLYLRVDVSARKSFDKTINDTCKGINDFSVENCSVQIGSIAFDGDDISAGMINVSIFGIVTKPGSLEGYE